MPWLKGGRLGPYEILAPLGAGGMGEVYRARDTRLGREIALKLLPEAFARDAERLALKNRIVGVGVLVEELDAIPVFRLVQRSVWSPASAEPDLAAEDVLADEFLVPGLVGLVVDIARTLARCAAPRFRAARP